MSSQHPAQDTRPSLFREGDVLNCRGDWTAPQLNRLELVLHELRGERGASWQLQTSEVSRLDTAGALMLHRLRRRLEGEGVELDLSLLSERHRDLLELVRETQAEPPPRPRFQGPVEGLGRSTVETGREALGFLAFMGEFALDSLPRLLRPHRLRWRQVIAEIDIAGVRAIPILGLLIFLTGVVIAYQGGVPLEQYGANIFLVDLVVITMLREMAPLMTAIIVAGRTGSAYAAQIGTMRITEEIDALRVTGITPFEILALPKLIALILAMPLLTLFADVVGVFGGMVVANAMFDVSFAEFIRRIPDAMAPSSFWVGIIKAPVFAVIIASVGCYHGFAVRGSTESVGRATTRAVVHGIFLVIVVDALFSIIFNQLGL